MITIDWNPPVRTLRQFAVLQVVFFSIIAGWLNYRHGYVVAPAAMVSVSAVVGLVGWLFPPVMRVVWVTWMGAVSPIGWAVSYGVTAAIFYLVLTPIGLTMRLFGYDPLRLRFDPRAKSYWIRREQDPDSKRYFRQF